MLKKGLKQKVNQLLCKCLLKLKASLRAKGTRDRLLSSKTPRKLLGCPKYFIKTTKKTQAHTEVAMNSKIKLPQF